MSIPLFIEKSFLASLPFSEVEPIILNATAQGFDEDQEIPKPEEKSHLYLITEGEVLLCEQRNPKVEIQVLGIGRTLEMGKYFSQAKDWGFFWRTKTRVKIIRIPWNQVAALLQKHPEYCNYLQRISTAPELQKFNRVLRQLAIPQAARIDLIGHMEKADYANIFGDFDEKKFIVVSSGHIRINFYLDGGKHPLVDLQGGDEAVIDLRTESRSIDLIKSGDAWHISESKWQSLKTSAEIGHFLDSFSFSSKKNKMPVFPHVIGADFNKGPNKSVSSNKLQRFSLSLPTIFATLVVIISGAIAIAMQFGSSLLNRVIFDHTLPNQNLVEAAVIVGATFILSFFSDFIQKNISKILGYIGNYTKAVQASQILKSLTQAPKNFFTQKNQADIIDAFSNFTKASQLWGRFFSDTFGVTVSFGTVSLLLFYIIPQLGWIIPVASLSVIGVSLLLTFFGHLNGRTKQQAETQHFEQAFELISQADLYKANNIWPLMKSHWVITQIELQYRVFLENLYNSFENYFLDFFIEVIRLTVLFFAAKLFFDKQLSLGIAVSLPLILGVFLAQTRRFHSQLKLLMLARQADSKSKDLHEIPCDLSQERRPINGTNIVEVKNLNFSYGDSKSSFFLKGLTFDIREGEKVLILGSSGSGKSTLLGLLSGALESPKEIAKAFTSEDQVYIPQYCEILSGTVIDNLTGFRDDIEFEEIQKIVQLLDLTQTIERLPNSYQTQLESRGKYFSEGQRQTLQVAKLYLSNVKIGILDEATSLMDPVSEQRVLNQLFQRLKNQTVVFATQRSHLVPFFDKIIFMANGGIVEMGAHEELIAKRGLYFDYFCGQLRS